MAQGSLSELDTHMLIARKLDYIPEENYEALVKKVETISKMITGLIKSLKSEQ